MAHIVELSFAAIIAGFVSILGLIISKEQKTSEFRQTWIDALRSDIASLIAFATALQVALTNGSYRSTYAEVADHAKDDIRGINECAAKIRLRVNMDEPNSKDIVAQVERLEGLFAAGDGPDIEALNEVVKHLVRVSQVALKDEWKRVKAGEPIFRASKWTALAITIISILAFLVYSFKI